MHNVAQRKELIDVNKLPNATSRQLYANGPTVLTGEYRKNQKTQHIQDVTPEKGYMRAFHPNIVWQTY